MFKVDFTRLARLQSFREKFDLFVYLHDKIALPLSHRLLRTLGPHRVVTSQYSRQTTQLEARQTYSTYSEQEAMQRSRGWGASWNGRLRYVLLFS